MIQFKGILRNGHPVMFEGRILFVAYYKHFEDEQLFQNYVADNSNATVCIWRSLAPSWRRLVLFNHIEAIEQVFTAEENDKNLKSKCLAAVEKQFLECQQVDYLSVPFCHSP